MSRSLAPGSYPFPVHDADHLLGEVLLAGIGTGDIHIKRNGEYIFAPAASSGDPVNPRDNIGPDLVPT
jgi:hypothetical protein